MKNEPIDMGAFRYPHKTKSMKRRELNDQKLMDEFSAHPRFKGLDWYIDPSTKSRHRCLVYACTCGREMKLLPHSVRHGYNKELLCPCCVIPIRRRGVGSVNPALKETFYEKT